MCPFQMVPCPFENLGRTLNILYDHRNLCQYSTVANIMSPSQSSSLLRPTVIYPEMARVLSSTVRIYPTPCQHALVVFKVHFLLPPLTWLDKCVDSYIAVAVKGWTARFKSFKLGSHFIRSTLPRITRLCEHPAINEVGKCD